MWKLHCSQVLCIRFHKLGKQCVIWGYFIYLNYEEIAKFVYPATKDSAALAVHVKRDFVSEYQFSWVNVG